MFRELQTAAVNHLAVDLHVAEVERPSQQVDLQENYRGGSDCQGRESVEPSAQKSHIDEEPADLRLVLADPEQQHHPLQMHKACGKAQVEGTVLEDDPFHMDDVLHGVSLGADVDEVTRCRGVDLLVLAGDQQAGHTHQLVLLPADPNLRLGISVDEIDGSVESLREQLKLELDAYDPVHQGHPHALVDLLLILKGHAKRREAVQRLEVVRYVSEVMVLLVRCSHQILKQTCHALLDRLFAKGGGGGDTKELSRSESEECIIIILF